MPLVFVYGTLMRAGANHRVLARLGGRFVDEARTAEPRTLVDLGPYPALLPTTAPATTCVIGEVWEVDDSALRELDAFEGVPDLYTRERLAIVTDSETREAFTYVFARRLPKGARPIESGRYAAPGTALPTGASPAQIEGTADGLDNRPPTEDGSPPRKRRRERGPR